MCYSGSPAAYMHPIQNANVRNIPSSASAAAGGVRKGSAPGGRLPLPNLGLRTGMNPPAGISYRYAPPVPGSAANE